MALEAVLEPVVAALQSQSLAQRQACLRVEGLLGGRPPFPGGTGAIESAACPVEVLVAQHSSHESVKSLSGELTPLRLSAK